MISIISIYKKDLLNIKIEIYHQIMGVITKSQYSNRCLLNKFPELQFKNFMDIIALKNIAIENLFIMCANGNV